MKPKSVEVPALPEARDAFDTRADEVAVDLDATDRGTVMAPFTSATSEAPSARAPYASAPSTRELLERAAALGPARMTWESIVLPADPVLDEKRRPHVAERRARLTRIVKATLGACLGVCVLALAVSAVSASGSSDASKGSASAAASERTFPATVAVSVESLDGAKRGKASRRITPVVTAAAIVRAKHR